LSQILTLKWLKNWLILIKREKKVIIQKGQIFVLTSRKFLASCGRIILKRVGNTGSQGERIADVSSRFLLITSDSELLCMLMGSKATSNSISSPKNKFLKPQFLRQMIIHLYLSWSSNTSHRCYTFTYMIVFRVLFIIIDSCAEQVLKTAYLFFSNCINICSALH
jgi:hypothetical protein